MKRERKDTIAYWIRFYHFALEVWDIVDNKWTNQASVEIVCYTPGDPFNRHEFYL